MTHVQTADERFVLGEILGRYYFVQATVYNNSGNDRWKQEQASAKMFLLCEIARQELGWSEEDIQKQAKITL